MNQAALFDGLLALTALWLATNTRKKFPSVFLGSMLLGSAATLGALRFSGLLPLPQLHQYLSLLGAGAGLPLLGITIAMPQSSVARQARYAWILACAVCVIATVLVIVLQFKLWSSITALAAALAILVTGARWRQPVPAVSGLCMLATLLLFAARTPVPLLVPGDVLHIGLTVSLMLIGRHLHGQHS